MDKDASASADIGEIELRVQTVHISTWSQVKEKDGKDLNVAVDKDEDEDDVGRGTTVVDTWQFCAKWNVVSGTNDSEWVVSNFSKIQT